MNNLAGGQRLAHVGHVDGHEVEEVLDGVVGGEDVHVHDHHGVQGAGGGEAGGERELWELEELKPDKSIKQSYFKYRIKVNDFLPRKNLRDRL